MSVSLEQIGFVHDCANDDSGNLRYLTPITSSIDSFINYCTEKTVLNLAPFMLKKRLSRSDANGDVVTNHYDHCKELVIYLIDTYITNAAMNISVWPHWIQNLLKISLKKKIYHRPGEKEVLLKIINDFVNSMEL